MSTQDQIANLSHTLERLETDLANGVEHADRKSQRVMRLIYALIVVIGAMSLMNIYFVNGLTQEVRLVIRNMNEMEGYFGHVSEGCGCHTGHFSPFLI